MSYRVIYDSANWFDPMWAVMTVVAVLLALVLVRALLQPDAEWRRSSSKRGSLLGGLAIIGVLVAVVTINVVGNSWSLRNASRPGNCRQIEGVVTDFTPESAFGHRKESFNVEGFRFSYSSYDLTDRGFRWTHGAGGPIHEGLPVRICFVSDGNRNAIVRLETAGPSQAAKHDT